MKSFFKTTLAVILGIFISSILSLMLLGGFVNALSGGSKQPVLPKEGVLKIDMSAIAISEQTTPEDPMAMLQSQEIIQPIGMRDATNALKIAAIDPGVKYIYLKTDASMTSISALWEFRKALQDFRSSGKAVIAYTETPSTGSYYLASVADKIYMTHSLGATTTVTGISGRLIFLKDLLDKFGVNVQLIRHGKYKSAGEMYIRSNASAENMEQNMSMVNSMWETISSEIAESRGISVDALNSAINDLKLCTPEDFLACSLVDGLLSREELRSKLADLAVTDDYKKVKMIPFEDYVAVKTQALTLSKKKIAVIFANGQILDGDAAQEVTGDRFASIIAKVRRDTTIKAVVLRVNSPGGSVLASEKIKDEMDLLCATKPVAASYGDYAASGGYWISNNCDHIFSTPLTLTGSIGVFGMIPDFSKTAKNIAHVTITPVNSNRHSDMYTLMRPFDSAETAYMQRSIEGIYTKFVNMVAQGRDLTPEYVDEIAQGRVWTGIQGASNGLVDEIGTLEDAIQWAAAAAGDATVKNWAVEEFPKPATMMEMLLEMLQPSSSDELEAMAMAIKKDLSSAKVVARLPYVITVN